jgi:hypothetical protein
MAVGGDHLEYSPITSISLVVIGDNLVRELLEQKFEIHDITPEEQVAKTDIVILLQEVYVTKLGTAPLMRHIRESVAGSSTNTDSIGKLDASIHERIENTAREDTTHASTLEHEARLRRDIILYISHYSLRSERSEAMS